MLEIKYNYLIKIVFLVDITFLNNFVKRNGDDLTIRTRTLTFTGRLGLIAMPSAVLGKKRASGNVSGFIPKAVWDLSSKCQTANATMNS